MHHALAPAQAHIWDVKQTYLGGFDSEVRTAWRAAWRAVHTVL
jgi:hypothetical protein